MMKTAAEIINSKIDFEKGVDYFYPSEIEPMMELYADQYKQEIEAWRKQSESDQTHKEKLAKEKVKLKLLSQELLEALKKLHYESMASDFNEHWDSYKEAEGLIAKAEEKLKQK